MHTIPVVTSSTSIEDEDATLHLERIIWPDEDAVLSIWSTTQQKPKNMLGHVLVSEHDFITFLASAGYTVTRTFDER